jgi:hypothetical protein
VWEARYEELSEVSAIGKISGVTSGVRCRTSNPKEWIVFWTMNRPEVLMELAARGLTVNTTLVPLSYRRPGRN